MNEETVRPQRILDALANSQVLVFDQVPLDVFRDVYHATRGFGEKVIWNIVLVGDQALVQSVNHPSVQVLLCEGKHRYYSKRDFDFMCSDDFVMVGTVKGRYTLRKFINDVFTWRTMFAAVLIGWIVFCLCDRMFSQATVQNLSSSLISAMSIFVSIFVLFVLSIDSNSELCYFQTGRLEVLAQSDKYIGSIGIVTLLLSILSSLFGTSLTSEPLTSLTGRALKSFSSLFLSASVVGTLLSFWLVLHYHFGRRHEMSQISLARSALAELNRENP